MDFPAVKVKPLLSITAEDHQMVRELFFQHIYRPPLFRADTEARRRELLQSFLSSLIKVPIFWLREDYERSKYSLRHSLIIYYSNGNEIKELQAAFTDFMITLTDTGDSYAFLEQTSKGAVVRWVIFNPRSPW